MKDITIGYCDGFSDERMELPNNSNYSPAYIHGWLNGRDDRIKKPRASAKVLLKQADLIEKAYVEDL